MGGRTEEPVQDAHEGIGRSLRDGPLWSSRLRGHYSIIHSFIHSLNNIEVIHRERVTALAECPPCSRRSGGNVSERSQGPTLRTKRLCFCFWLLPHLAP